MSKTIFTLLSIIVFLFPWHSKAVVSNILFEMISQHINTNKSRINFLTNPIVGKWRMCQTGYENHIINSNICTDIIFDEKGDGVIIYPGDKLNFNWLEIDGKIKFTFVSDKDKDKFGFSNTELSFKLYEDDRGKWIKLIDESSNSWYLLGKSRD